MYGKQDIELNIFISRFQNHVLFPQSLPNANAEIVYNLSICIGFETIAVIIHVDAQTAQS